MPGLKEMWAPSQLDRGGGCRQGRSNPQPFAQQGVGCAQNPNGWRPKTPHL